MVAARGIAPLSAACRAAVLLLDDAASSALSAMALEWWTWRASNPQPSPCEGDALPVAPQAQMVAVAGLEPAISSLWGWRAAAALHRVAGWAGGSRTLRRPCIRRLHSCRCATAQWWRRPGLHRYFPLARRATSCWSTSPKSVTHPGELCICARSAVGRNGFYSVAALSIEAFERPPQGRFTRNANSMILLFAIMEPPAGFAPTPDGYKPSTLLLRQSGNGDPGGIRTRDLNRDKVAGTPGSPTGPYWSGIACRTCTHTFHGRNVKLSLIKLRRHSAARPLSLVAQRAVRT